MTSITADEIPLTEREWEVLALVAQGKRNREIAQELGVCEKTVEYHVTNILGKLGLPNRTAAVIWALRTGLIAGGGKRKHRTILGSKLGISPVTSRWSCGIIQITRERIPSQ